MAEQDSNPGYLALKAMFLSTMPSWVVKRPTDLRQPRRLAWEDSKERADDCDGRFHVSLWVGCSPQLLNQMLDAAVKVFCSCDQSI